MPEHLPLSPGLPGSVAGAHRGGSALAPAPESCRGDPQAGGERQHARSGRRLPAGPCRGVGGTPARAKLSCNAHPWHWVLIRGCAWVCTCVCAVGDA